MVGLVCRGKCKSLVCKSDAGFGIPEDGARESSRLGIPKRARAAAATAGQGLQIVDVECLKVAQRVRVPLGRMGTSSVKSGSGF